MGLYKTPDILFVVQTDYSCVYTVPKTLVWKLFDI